MKLKKGEEVVLKSQKNENSIKAIVKSFDEVEATFELNGNLLVTTGENIAVLTASEDVFYADVIKKDGNLLIVKWAWEKSRRFFRVDDVIQVSLKKIEPQKLYRCRMFYGLGQVCSIDINGEDYGVNPYILKILKNIDEKLSMLLERIEMEREGFNKTDFQIVNISASGIRLVTKEDCMEDDIVEIKMLLPSVPTIGIIAYGKVIKVKDVEGGKEIAVNFIDMDEEICDELVQYTLKRQREFLRKQKKHSYE